MKYELPCEVVKDLLPLYVDDLTSENVAESVEAHILTCSDCRKAYDGMKNTNDIQIQAQTDKSLMKKAKKRFNKKLTLVGLVVAIVASVATLTGAAAVYKYGDVIKSNDITAIVTEIDFNSLDFDDDNAGYTYNGRHYEISEKEYAKAKENGIVQKIHLNSKYTSETMSSAGYEINGEYIYFVTVESNGKTADKNKENSNGWNWMQAARPIDKIVYINSKSGMLSNNADKYKIIWEKQKSLSVNEIVKEKKKIQDEADGMEEPKLLWKSDEVYGKEKAWFEMNYWKDYNYEMDEMEYALDIKLKADENSHLNCAGVFVDYNRFINDNLLYDYDVWYGVEPTKDECYYWSIVPSDCAYAEIEGQRLDAKKTTINIEGVDYETTYICGVVDNVSGNIYNSQGRVTLFDNKGNAHTESNKY